MTLVDSSGSPIILGPQLGSGGEAVIYKVASLNHPGNTPLVAKVYHHASPDKTEKLKEMLVDPPDDPMQNIGHISICWPQRLIYGPRSECLGFLMPQIELKSSIPVFRLYNPLDRLRTVPLFNWEYLLRTGINFSAAIEAFHDHKYVVGDINESNVLVNNRALVTIVDCDSIQVPRDNGGVFRCPVGKPDFTPPELQGVDFNSVDRKAEHDNFGLGVLLFMLLMEGVHPFAGVWTGPGEPPSVEMRIKNGYCPYVNSGSIKPMPISPRFEMLPAEVRVLFSQCFLTGHTQPWKRPTPGEWRKTLEATVTSLRSCRKNTHHRYADHLTSCPWCERQLIMKGIDSFPAKSTPQQGVSFVPSPQLAPRHIAADLYSKRPLIFSYTLTHALIGLLLSFLWRPVLVSAFQQAGLDQSSSSISSLAVAFAAFLLIACYRVLRTTTRVSIKPTVQPLVRTTPASPRPFASPKLPIQPSPSNWQTPRAHPYSPAKTTGTFVVGSRIRLIYHSSSCEWARKISSQNRIQFSSSTAAQAAGYRRCQVCRP